MGTGMSRIRLTLRIAAILLLFSATASAELGTITLDLSPGPANPLVSGRRVELERECLALVTEVASMTGEDPVDVIAAASGYKGAATTKLNPATMSDDRLANTVRDLRADAAALRAKGAKSGTAAS